MLAHHPYYSRLNYVNVNQHYYSSRYQYVYEIHWLACICRTHYQNKHYTLMLWYVYVYQHWRQYQYDYVLVTPLKRKEKKCKI